MNMERTISIIKPDAIFKNLIGVIIARFEVSGLMVVAMKMLRLNRNQIKEFYFEHREKLFFNDLVNFIASGPIIVQVLEGKNAIRKNRDIMGSTNPEKALSGTLRADYADDCTKNIVHGSDSLESAKREISYFFRKDEIYDRV